MSRKFKILLVTVMLGSLNPFAKPDTLANDSITYNPYPVDTIPEVNDTQLHDLVVEGSNLQHKGNLTTNIFSQEDFDRSHNACELLGTTPGMNFDINTKELKYLNSTNLKLLVDGVSKDPAFIKTLDPNKYYKVEITSHPIGKYADYDAVINLISRPNYSGVQFHIDVSQTINPDSPFKQNRIFTTTEGKGSFAMTYNKWTVEAFIFDGWQRSGDNVNQTIIYPFNDLKWTYSKASDKRVDNLKYYLSQDYLFTLGYEINPFHKLSYGCKISVFNYRQHSLYNFTSQTLDSQIVSNNTLNIYSGDKYHDNFFWMNYNGRIKKWELSSEVIYSFGNQKKPYSRDYSSDTDFINNLKSNSWFIVGNIDASKSFLDNTLKLQLNEDLHYYKMKSADSNNNHSKSYNFTNTLFAGLGYYPNNKFGVSASAGCYIIRIAEGELKNTYLNPRIDAMISWQPHKNFFTRLNYTLTSSRPALEDSQNFGYFTDELTYFHGNPNLKPKLSNSLNLLMTFFNSLNISVQYYNIKDPTVTIRTLAEGTRPDQNNGYYICSTPENGKRDDLIFHYTYTLKIGKHWTMYTGSRVWYENSHFKESKQKGWFGNGEIQFSFYTLNNTLQATAAYVICSNGDIAPQYKNRSNTDIFGMALQKLLCKNRLAIAFKYTLPVHLISGKSTTEIISQPYYSKSLSSNNLFFNNQFVLQLEYNFHKGDEVKQNMKNIGELK